MSEKMYARLLRLYPSAFRKEYQSEALQLIRDRARDETGLFNRARLWWDLATDILTGLPQAYKNSYATIEAAPLSATAESIPSFKTLDRQPLRPGSILVAGTLSLAAAAAFGFLPTFRFQVRMGGCLRSKWFFSVSIGPSILIRLWVGIGLLPRPLPRERAIPRRSLRR
jgi:hypothetical protein